MSEQDLEGTYVVEKLFLDEILKDNTIKLSILESLIQYSLGEKNISGYDIYLLCENYVVNYKITTLIENIFRYSGRVEPQESAKKEELIVSAQDMFMLQTLALAKQYALTDLQNTTHLSISLH